MKPYTFQKAVKIFPISLQDAMNVSLFFVADFDLENDGFLHLTGNSSYRIYDQAKIVGYGPARAAHHYYRIDSFSLKKGHHRLVIELSSYRCNSYYYLNTTPFIQAEVLCQGVVLAFTGKDFTCYLNETRVQKVTRFSFQRTFAEAYRFPNILTDFLVGKSNPFSRLDVQTVEEKVTYLNRRAPYPTLRSIPFVFVESGTVTHNTKLPVYDDRYMHQKDLLIFDKTTWEIDANQTISQLDFKFLQNVKPAILVANTYATYQYFSSKTGFLRWSFDCHEDAIVHIIFDEINLTTPPQVQLSFYRNTTHNIISYELSSGQHDHVSFEPYTTQYARIIVVKGSITIKSFGMTLYENPEAHRFKYSFAHPKIQKIMDAAVATFAQNAVDVLTDCPSRERAGWLCDSFFTGQAERFFTGNNKVERSFLENYGLSIPYPTLPQGMVPMCYPGEFPDGNYIPNWAMFYILEIENMANRTHNQSLLHQSKDKIIGIIKYFERYENELGLLENLEGWVFVEWSKANDQAFIEGVNIPSNILYAACLSAASRILHIPQYEEKATSIQAMIRKTAYNGTFFVDNLIRDHERKLRQTEHISEVCQYYAFYFNVATKDYFSDLFNILIHQFGPHRDPNHVFPNVAKANVFIGNYLRLSILHSHHSYQQVLSETVDYFFEMAIRTGTLWEHDSPHASLNHGFASYIAILIVYSLCGIEKIDYLNKKIYCREIKPITSFNISIPLQRGCINIYTHHDHIVMEAPDNFQVIK